MKKYFKRNAERIHDLDSFVNVSANTDRNWNIHFLGAPQIGWRSFSLAKRHTTKSSIQFVSIVITNKNLKMLPTGDDTDNMEQSTLNYVFQLFGKGVTQMLQQSVNQQTVIDELRAQNRSLQTQVANLTASLDEVEDRLFAKLQNMQPTIYTREGIPIDDALDTLTSKIQSLNEKMINNTDAVSKVDAELNAKVDRDEFQLQTNEQQKMGESFSDISNTMQAIQKEMQKMKQDSADVSDRMLQTIKFQIESHNMSKRLNEDQDMTQFITRDELKHQINKLKLAAASTAERSKEDLDQSAVVQYTLSNGMSEEKVKDAYTMLKKRKRDLDQKYKKDKENIDNEMSKLIKIAKNAEKTSKKNYSLDEDEEESEEDTEDEEKMEEDKGENNEEEDDNDDENEDDDDYEDVDDDAAENKEFRTIGIDTVRDIINEEGVEVRLENFGGKRRNIGLTVKPSSLTKKKGSKRTKNADTNDDVNEDDESESEVEVEETVHPKASKSKKGKKKSHKKSTTKSKPTKKKTRSSTKEEGATTSSTKRKSKIKEYQSIVDEMEQDLEDERRPRGTRGTAVTGGSKQIQTRIDEGKLTQKVLEAVMPRVESLLIDSLAPTNQSGLKLEKNEAKQLIAQLSSLDEMKNELKSLKVKISVKMDRSKCETELKERVTREELFKLLYQFFPENESIRSVAPKQTQSKLPPLTNRRSPSSMNNNTIQQTGQINTTTNNNNNVTNTVSTKITTSSMSTKTTNSNKNNNSALSKSATVSTKGAASSGMSHPSHTGSLMTGLNTNNGNSASNTNNGIVPTNSNNNVTSSSLNNPNNNLTSSSLNNNNMSYQTYKGGSSIDNPINAKNMKAKTKMTMKPSRNSNMVSLNQKFLKGVDGHYYLRDMANDPNEMDKSNGNYGSSMFGMDNSEEVDINAAFDFQPFTKVEESINIVKNIREETPHDD